MSIFIKYLKWFLIGIVSLCTLVFLGIWLLVAFGSDLGAPPFVVIVKYRMHADAFDKVCSEIDHFDLSEYALLGTEISNVIILSNHTDAKPYYQAYIHTDSDIELNPVNTFDSKALAVLFHDLKIEYIVQTNDTVNRSVYFFYNSRQGIVYSRNGAEPIDRPNEADYKFKRINSDWFYWASDYE